MPRPIQQEERFFEDGANHFEIDGRFAQQLSSPDNSDESSEIRDMLPLCQGMDLHQCLAPMQLRPQDN